MSNDSSTAVEAAALDSALNAIGTLYYDVTIICTTDDYQALYWMDILENGLLAGQKVLAVSEDWIDKGGAGNGLGTLYAWQKACTLAKSKYDNYDLDTELQNNNVSVALYHTAGKGTRLAPLPASENNNKPGVKLPFPLQTSDGTIRPLSVLESVIRQTGIYARRGRLSVFWGDQVFIPTAPYDVPATHHIDILCTLLGDKAPTATEWTEQGLDKYGVIVVLNNGEAAQVEKVSHATAMNMLSELGTIQQVGPSLGSFSVSAIFLKALVETFSTELAAKTSKLDTDPHFWMPLTLPQPSYVSLMKQKGTSEEESSAHYERMEQMKTKFLSDPNTTGYGLFGALNVGKSACWWDYGQLKLYSANCLLLLDQESSSAKLLRRYLGIGTDHVISSKVTEGTSLDNASYIVSSTIGSGTVTNSLLANVTAQSVETDGAIVINCAAKKITAAPKSILFNIIATDENEVISTEPGDVVVGVLSADGTTNIRLRSRMDIDGGQVWKIVLKDGTAVNELSFEQIHANNFNANIGAIAKYRQVLYDTIVTKLGL